MNQSRSHQEKTLEQLRSMSDLFDNAIPIPGTPYRVGLDPILGLLPAVGDYLGAIFSGYIVVKAALIGASKATLSRMVLNILFDALVGTVPLLGDIFDVTWKANVKNIELLEAHLSLPQHRQRVDWVFMGVLLGGLVLALFLITVMSLSILRGLLRLIGG
jgi:Domain of unknown function (DUF4112)